MSKLSLVTLDTRGGVQPYIALAAGLRRAGHDVRLVAPGDYRSIIEGHGLSFAPLSGSIDEVIRLSRGVAEKGALAAMRLARVETLKWVKAWSREVLAGCEDRDAMIGGIGGMVAGLGVAEKLGIPFYEAHLQPVGAASSTFPGVLLPGVPRWLGKFGRRVSHSVSEFGIWAPFKGAMSVARREVLGLNAAPNARPRLPVVYGFSPEVIPPPSDWEANRHITGYWTLPAGTWTAPEALLRFLDAGPPPVCVGFGSMAAEDPGALTALVLEATHRAGLRAVLLSGWGGLTVGTRDDVFALPEAPHDWLFPRMAAVVHHGGAGTTGAGLCSGVPSLVVPFTMDQPFWGSRVWALGAGPQPIPRKKLSVEALSRALSLATTDEPMKARARSVGAKIRAEDGVGRAVSILSGALGGRSSQPA